MEREFTAEDRRYLKLSEGRRMPGLSDTERQLADEARLALRDRLNKRPAEDGGISIGQPLRLIRGLGHIVPIDECLLNQD